MSRWIILLALLWLVWRIVRGRLLQPPAPRRPARPADVPGWDPYEVLGVAHGASNDEITQAYRERMKQYHPDRVADLGPELRELAHRKTIEIQRAWTELRK